MTAVFRARVSPRAVRPESEGFKQSEYPLGMAQQALRPGEEEGRGGSGGSKGRAAR